MKKFIVTVVKKIETTIIVEMPDFIADYQVESVVNIPIKLLDDKLTQATPKIIIYTSRYYGEKDSEITFDFTLTESKGT